MAGVRRATAALASIAAGVALAGCGAAGTTGVIMSPAAARVGPSGTPTPAHTPTPSPSPKALGKGEGAVSVLALRGYAEYGGVDPMVNWIGSFEGRTGCRVRLTFADRGNVERTLAGGSFDVVSAPPELAGRLIAERKAAPLTTSLVAHYHDLPKFLRELPGLTAHGRVYGVPYLWAYHRLAYDRTRFGKDEAPKDAGALFREAGPVMLRDHPLTIADAALALTGSARPKDPYRLTPAQLDAAVALLAGRKGDDRSYWRDSLDVITGFAAGRLGLAQALPYQTGVLDRAGRPVGTIAAGRTTGWADSWMVLADAAAPNCAYRWIGHMISRDVQRDAAAWTGMAPANPKGCTGRTRRVCDDYRVSDRALPGKIAFAVRPAKDCGDGRAECTDYAEWDKRWQELVK
jgi:putative spermidine/putrescine transport system substrate-binding protein